MNNQHIIINSEFNNQRLDKVLALLVKELTRTKAQELIDQGKVKVNGEVAKASLKVKENDVVEIEQIEQVDNGLHSENIPLDIVYEDDDVLVINKPIGMVVHPANGHYEGTLVNALLYHFEELSTISGETRPGIVHRLDKETSGLIMVAKNNFAHLDLSKQLKAKTAYRRYLALVHGELPHNEGTIMAPIGRKKDDRKKMAVVADGKDAVTHFKVLERLPGYTFIECILETGRTHQIRVHLQTIKFPIVGDNIYGPKKMAYDYQLLHATTLAFNHPRTGNKVEVNAPLPKHFEEALENLRTTGNIKGVN